ncbi:MAG: hypothetical protein KF905_08080 [Flavobacteriales bacterium]|nr:hypothetical protein [Flavobacteriales bacterium]
MKWLNLSYNDPAVERVVNATCGMPIGLWERLKLGGIGTARMDLLDAPGVLMADIDRAEDRRFCHIEFRSKGLIIRCRSRLETLGVPLPYVGSMNMKVREDGHGGQGALILTDHEGGIWAFRPHPDHWASTIALLNRHLPTDELKLE